MASSLYASFFSKKSRHISKIYYVHLYVGHIINIRQQWDHWVQSKRHRLWFSTKTCSCCSTKTYVDSLILSSIWLRWETNTLKCRWCSTKSNSIWEWGSCSLHEFSLSNNYTVFVENHSLWRFDSTQWRCLPWILVVKSPRCASSHAELRTSGKG